MSLQQMRDRCPSAKSLGIGFVRGYKLAFTRKGSYRDGGVASIVETKDLNDRVYGVIWELTPEDMRTLDEVEDPDAYLPETVQVIQESGEALECATYIAIPQSEYVSPDPDYFSILLSAACEIGLPGDYIEQIKRLAPDAQKRGGRVHNNSMQRTALRTAADAGR